MPKRLLTLGFACVLAAGLTACGSADPEPEVASVQKQASASSKPAAADKQRPSPTPTLVSQEEWTRLLNACLSEELPDMVGKDGKVTNTRKTDPRFQAAIKKCMKDLPPAEEPEPEPPSAELLARQRDYAKCMRDKGIAAFPDPDPAGKEPGPNDPQPPYGATDAEWQRAFDKCYGLLDPMFTPGVGVG